MTVFRHFCFPYGKDYARYRYLSAFGGEDPKQQVKHVDWPTVWQFPDKESADLFFEKLKEVDPYINWQSERVTMITVDGK